MIIVLSNAPSSIRVHPKRRVASKANVSLHDNNILANVVHNTRLQTANFDRENILHIRPLHIIRQHCRILEYLSLLTARTPPTKGLTKT